MTTTIYAHYGLLGAEKRTVYSCGRGEIYDELVVDIPDDLYAGCTSYGEPLISVEGEIYLLSEALCGNDVPCIRYFHFADGDFTDVVRELPVLSRTEHYNPMG
jgi:hypothetical protein